MTNSAATFLGIYLDTSGLRASLGNAVGLPIGNAAATYPSDRPKVGWSKQDPALWLDTFKVVISDPSKQFSEQMAKLDSLVTTVQIHGATLLHGCSKVLRPCILLNDTRSHAEADELNANPTFREQSYNILLRHTLDQKLVTVALSEKLAA